MQLTPAITLVDYSSLQELAAIPFPVQGDAVTCRAYIDISVGLRQIEVHSSAPFEGWRQIVDEDTRIEICPDTTGAQVADALLDSRVITAIEQVINPPPMNWKVSKAEVAKLTGMEASNAALANLIGALSVHMLVIREKPVSASYPDQGILI